MILLPDNICDILSTDGLYIGKIDSSVFVELESLYYVSDGTGRRFLKEYNQYFTNVSLSNDIMCGLNSVILGWLDNYYKCKAMVRDINLVETLPKPTRELHGHASLWHTDYADSIALMILMNDISIMDSHMEYVTGGRYPCGKRYPCGIDLSGCNIIDCIGERGTFFLFDNGFRVHRAKLMDGVSRHTIHVIFNKIRV